MIDAMGRKVKLPLLIFVFILFFSACASAQPVQKKPVQKWSGTITYKETSALTQKYESTWMHATAKGTPVSHKTISLNSNLGAVFTLVRNNPQVMATINYSQTSSEDVRSEATVLCRQPNTKPFYTGLSRSFSTSMQIAGGGKVKAQASISMDRTTGEYTISVNAPSAPARGSMSTRRSESFVCGPKKETPAEPSFPPYDTKTPDVTAEAFGKVNPKNTNVLSGSAQISKNARLTWNLRAELVEDVEAIHGPYVAKRGEDVTLDGSRSKGKDLTYEWTFAPKCAGGPNDKVKLTGASVKVKLLCDTSVRLRVSDGDRTDAKAVIAKIKARDWGVTEVKHEAEKKYFVDKTAMSTEFHTVHFFGGGNRCAEHNTMEAGEKHYLHPTYNEGWENTVYTAQQVTDGGPFDGMFYTEKGSEKLRVKRVSWINADLLPSSTMGKENAKKAARAKDFNTLGKQVEEHERVHTTLLEEIIKQNDPMTSIEFMVGLSKEDLNNKVTAQLVNAENQLRDVTLNEQEVKVRVKKKKQFNRSGKVLVPMADGSGKFGVWKIKNFADLGDE